MQESGRCKACIRCTSFNVVVVVVVDMARFLKLALFSIECVRLYAMEEREREEKTS